MPLQKIKICGYRGFSSAQSMALAIPNGTFGSGLTIITGSNNSGKSSILECLRARSGYGNVSFTTGTRNSNRDEVSITYTIDGMDEELRSVSRGSSETIRENAVGDLSLFVLPSRRAFEPYFGKSERDRKEYQSVYGLPSQRASVLPEFSSRLFRIIKNPNKFNSEIEKILGYCPTWTIDQNDQGSYFLKFIQNETAHSSDGMGEGIVSLFSIIDALYDSSPGDVVVIDEPELSLHPALQKRLAQMFLEYSADRQLIISTHSPYFVILESLTDGAHLVRVVNSEAEGTKIFELSYESKKSIKMLAVSNFNNPHVLGLGAREIFFEEDGIILTEGQEDVVFFPLVAEQLDVRIPGQLFGWGIGGASNMATVSGVLNDLGFKKVAGLLDQDKLQDLPALRSRFPSYFFSTIPAKDIRTKKSRKATDKIEGLLDESRKIRPAYVEDTRRLFVDLTEFMKSMPSK